ncbi:MAG: hypothetical protein K8T90_00520 [Planctomycetes bacterium]|nr:hypothetical protein [Planctomycetota bacterium]
MTTADLGDFVLRWQPDVASVAVRRLTLAAMVDAEASREGAEIAPGAVEAAAGAALGERVRRLRIEHGSGADIDELLRSTYGRTLDGLRDDFRRAVRTDLLRERLARLDGLRRDGVELRVVVAPDERTARAIASQWRDGADAALFVARLGLRPPAAPPPVAIEDIPERPLRERLASAPSGSVLDPVPFEAEDPERPGDVTTWWQVFKVIRAWKASSDPWSVVAAQVEASIRESPPSDEETAAWEQRAARRLRLARWTPASGFGASPPDGTIRRP